MPTVSVSFGKTKTVAALTTIIVFVVSGCSEGEP